jgi:hypothetical protein
MMKVQGQYHLNHIRNKCNNCFFYSQVSTISGVGMLRTLINDFKINKTYFYLNKIV